MTDEELAIYLLVLNCGGSSLDAPKDGKANWIDCILIKKRLGIPSGLWGISEATATGWRH